MRRAGDGWRPPRPTTCGRSTGAWPTPDRRPVAVVTDSSADLADSVLDRHHIALVPLQVVFGDTTFRDRVELKPEEFYRRLRDRPGAPTTSQPTPAEFVRVLRDARARGGRGRRRCCSRPPLGHLRRRPRPRSARRGSRASIWWTAARRRWAWACWRSGARSWPRRGGRAREIAGELERVRGQSGMLLTVDRYDNLLRSGRVSRGKAWIAGMLDVKPILSLDAEGRVVPVDRVRGRDQLVPRVLALLEQRLTPRPRGGAVRRGAHGGAGDGRAGAGGAGRGVPPARLLRDPGDRRARHPRGRRRLGHLLSGRGRHPRPARRGQAGARDRRHAGRSGR